MSDEEIKLSIINQIKDDLAGSYNEDGIKRWFIRPRVVLGGVSPSDVLSGDWDPENPEVKKVQELARELRQ